LIFGLFVGEEVSQCGDELQLKLLKAA